MSSRSQDRQREHRAKGRRRARAEGTPRREKSAATAGKRPMAREAVEREKAIDTNGERSARAVTEAPRTTFMTVAPPHPAQLEKELFLRQCAFAFGRSSGPGGQHRNKVETTAEIVHSPTGVTAAAGERRSQSVNRHEAVRRLRLKLARVVRTPARRSGYQPTELWRTRRQGEKMPVNSAHWDYPALLAEALDVIISRGFDVAGAAGTLGITMSQLTKLVRDDKAAFAIVNEGRLARGLPQLRK